MRHKRERFDKPYVYERDGVMVVETRENIGYGFTHYILTGKAEALDKYAEELYRFWPPQGYSTIVYWPPELATKFTEDVRPVDNGDGTWTAKAWRANSCD